MNMGRVGTIGLCVAVLAACGQTSAGKQVGAYRACERAVGTELKAPSTADYSGYTGSTVTNNSGTYHVSGHVDSENSFGAKIRTSFACDLRDTGDNWDLVHINVG
jgi:hypothetical protein